MTQQKSSPKTTPAPRATPRRNPSMPAEQMLARAVSSTVIDSAAQVVEVYERLLADQPIATELFTPEPLRTAIEALQAELAK